VLFIDFKKKSLREKSYKFLHFIQSFAKQFHCFLNLLIVND
jgi:hypothetical protein